MKVVGSVVKWLCCLTCHIECYYLKRCLRAWTIFGWESLSLLNYRNSLCGSHLSLTSHRESPVDTVHASLSIDFNSRLWLR